MLPSKCSFTVLFLLAAHNGAQAVNAMHVTRLPFSNDFEKGSSMAQKLVPDQFDRFGRKMPDAVPLDGFSKYGTLHFKGEDQLADIAFSWNHKNDAAMVYWYICHTIGDRRIRGCSKIWKNHSILISFKIK